MQRRPPPQPAEGPSAKRRAELSADQQLRIERAAREAGVPADPWVAWARAAAWAWGAAEATRRAALGAATEPEWAMAPEPKPEPTRGLLGVVRARWRL